MDSYAIVLFLDSKEGDLQEIINKLSVIALNTYMKVSTI